MTANREYSNAMIGACKSYPNMAPAIFSLIPRETTKVPYAAVDAYWRIYINPDTFGQLPYAQRVGIILHECFHLVLKHHQRADALCLTQSHLQTWNEAADSIINQALRNDGIPLPDGGIYPETLNLKPGMSTEQTFRELCKRAAQQPPPQPQPQPGGQGDEGDQQDQDGPNQAQAADGNEDSSGDDPDSGSDGDGDSAASGDASQGGNEGSQPAGNEGDAGQGSQQGAAGQDSGQGSPAPKWEGGSCSDGVQRPWEEGPPQNYGDGRLEHEGDEISRKVAERAKEKGRGTGRNNSSLEINEIPTLIINPYRTLLRKMKKTSEQVRGAGVRNYRRLSRTSPRDVLIGQSKQPVPKITIVLDTSGSMAPEELAMGVALVKKVIDCLKLRNGVRFVTGDSGCNTKELVYRDASMCNLRGGGGTDMSMIAREVVEDPKTRPELLVIVTDGDTPWPSVDDLRGVPCVVALTTSYDYSIGIPDHIESVNLAETCVW